MIKTFLVKNISELDEVVKHLVFLSKENNHFCFEAEMGYGKTTLIKKLCKELGVLEHVSSPTYSIVNEYLGINNKTIYHFDLYRLKDEIELLDIGIEEILDSHFVCFFEWPKKVYNFLPSNYVRVIITIKNEIRIFTIEIV